MSDATARERATHTKKQRWQRVLAVRVGDAVELR